MVRQARAISNQPARLKVGTIAPALKLVDLVAFLAAAFLAGAFGLAAALVAAFGFAAAAVFLALAAAAAAVVAAELALSTLAPSGVGVALHCHTPPIKLQLEPVVAVA